MSGKKMVVCIDPRRITERLHGGPHFARFEMLSDDLIQCPRTGEIFSVSKLGVAWDESRNLDPEHS